MERTDLSMRDAEADSGRDRDAVDLDEETPFHGVRPFEAWCGAPGRPYPGYLKRFNRAEPDTTLGSGELPVVYAGSISIRDL